MYSKLIKQMALIGALLITQLAAAQDAATKTPGLTADQKAEKVTAHLKQQLSLSDDQSQKVKAVYIDHLQKRESKSGKRKEAHRELENNLSQILSKDQLDKFKNMETARREQMRSRRNQKLQPAPAEQGTNQDNTQPDGQK